MKRSPLSRECTALFYSFPVPVVAIADLNTVDRRRHQSGLERAESYVRAWVEDRRTLSAIVKDSGDALQMARRALQASAYCGWAWNVVGSVMRAAAGENWMGLRCHVLARDCALRGGGAGYEDAMANLIQASHELCDFEAVVRYAKERLKNDPRDGAGMRYFLMFALLADGQFAAFDRQFLRKRCEESGHLPVARALRFAILGDHARVKEAMDLAVEFNEHVSAMLQLVLNFQPLPLNPQMFDYVTAGGLDEACSIADVASEALIRNRRAAEMVVAAGLDSATRIKPIWGRSQAN